MRLCHFTYLGPATFDGGDLGLLFGRQVGGVLGLRLLLLDADAFQCGGNERLLCVLVWHGGGFLDHGQRSSGFFASRGRLGGELGGLLFLLALFPRKAEFLTLACLVGGGFFLFPRPYLALGEPKVIDQRNA